MAGVGVIQVVLRRLRRTWIAVQVELHGRYSVGRLHRLKVYMDTLSTTRMVAICLLMPLPCIVLAILFETFPLASPGDGIRANGVFALRFGLITVIMVGTLVFQMGKNVTGLTVRPRHIAVVSILSAIASVGTLYAVALTTVFPVPFTMLLASPPSIVVFGACFVYFWGAQVRQDPTIDVDMKREQAVSRCQVALTFIYPLYIAGFMSLSGIYQTMFVAVLPIIKLFSRNWVANALKDHNDLKPQAVTFIVEVFSALYVSNALSSSSSWMATAMIMTLDAVVVVQSTRDIMEVLSDVKLLMEKIPQTHPVAKENFVQIAVRLMAIEAQNLPQTLNRSSDALNPTILAEMEEWVSSKDLNVKREASQQGLGEVPKRPRQSQPQPIRIGSSKVHASGGVSSPTTATTTSRTAGDSLEAIFSKEERALFIHRIATVLFITEFIILAEYVELMLPVAYGLHHFVLYHLPNCAYYPALANLSSSDFSESNARMVVYCLLEFISLMVVILLLRRVLGFSTLCQLAFVLEMQAGIIQTQLISLLLYIMQISLAHIGKSASDKGTLALISHFSFLGSTILLGEHSF